MDNVAGSAMYAAQGGVMDQSNAQQKGQLGQFGGQAIINAYSGGVGTVQTGYMAAASLATPWSNMVKSGESFSATGRLLGSGAPDPKSLGTVK